MIYIFNCLILKFWNLSLSCKTIFTSETGIPVVREEWLIDSIEKKEAQPLDAYDIVSHLAVAGKGIPLDKQDPSEEAIQSIAAEVLLIFYKGDSYSKLLIGRAYL